MDPNEKKDPQILEHRGILSSYNQFIRRKSENADMRIPSEWDPSTAQAYRLLVGPNIKNYIHDSSTSYESNETDNSSIQQSTQKKHLKPLEVSRLKKDLEPVNVTEKNLEALHFPNDLLIQVFPPDSTKKLNTIVKPKKRSSPRIVKPNPRGNFGSYSRLTSFHSSSFGSFGSFQIPPDDITQPSEATLSSPQSPKLSSDSETDKQKQELEQNKVENIKTIVEEPQNDDKKETIPKRTDLKKLRSLANLRKYFYVLRCWASFQINARNKSAFVLDVHHSRIEKIVLTNWRLYSKRQIKKRNFLTNFNIFYSNTIQKKYYEKWKKLSEKAINDADIMTKAINFNNRNVQLYYIRIFHEISHSKRICRIETQKNFRFTPNGPFPKLNEYYTMKLNNNIKSLHFYFIKTIPLILNEWKLIIERTKHENEQIEKVYSTIQKLYFYKWIKYYQKHFHQQQMINIRMKSKEILHANFDKEREESSQIEKMLMIQLLRDRNMFNSKIHQFDRLSQNHSEAVLRRDEMRSNINKAMNEFFIQQEKTFLPIYYSQSIKISNKSSELRLKLADGFLYHLQRAVRSYNNEILTREYCYSFRVLSDPIVTKAVGYFHEKNSIKNLISIANTQRKNLRTIVECVKLYHQFVGWNYWKKFMKIKTKEITVGLMEKIRRRNLIMKRFPYFDCPEILNVRPPRPLKEIRIKFAELPKVSLQRKLEKEKEHHLKVKQMLIERRILREFFRAFASYVQIQNAIREVMILMRKRQKYRKLKIAFNALKVNAFDSFVEVGKTKIEIELDEDIRAWFKHFFKDRMKLARISEEIPFS